MTENEVAPPEINPKRFVSFFSFGIVGDLYRFTRAAVERGEVDRDDMVEVMLDTVGRVWWVRNPDDDGFSVAAGDFLEAHPESTWDQIYAREEQWSRDLDPFHGIFP